jgi:hypothetical protein
MKACNLCKREVKGNLHAEKIITCGRCVQILLTATQEAKIAFRDRLLEKGLEDEARCVESFIIPGNGKIATPKKMRHLTPSKCILRGVKPHSSYVFKNVSGG